MQRPPHGRDSRIAAEDEVAHGYGLEPILADENNSLRLRAYDKVVINTIEEN